MSIDKILWADSLKIKPIPSRVLIKLCSHYNDDTGRCFPSISSLQDSCQLSRQGVINAIKYLEDQKIIEVSREKNNSNKYKINTKWSTSLTSKDKEVVNDIDHPSQRGRLPLVVNEVDQGSQRGRPETVIKQETKTVKETVRDLCSPTAHVDLKAGQNLTNEYFDKPPYPTDDNSPDAIAWRTVEYLNERAGRSFQQISSNHKWIKQRLKYEQADEYTLKRIIDFKVSEWTSEKMKKFLRPQTLFAKDNFLKYRDEIEINEKENQEMANLIQDMKDPNWVNPIDAMRQAYANDTTTY